MNFTTLSCSTLAAKESLVYSYGRCFNGFAAKLSDEEVARLSGDIFVELESKQANVNNY